MGWRFCYFYFLRAPTLSTCPRHCFLLRSLNYIQRESLWQTLFSLALPQLGHYHTINYRPAKFQVSSFRKLGRPGFPFSKWPVLRDGRTDVVRPFIARPPNKNGQYTNKGSKLEIMDRRQRDRYSSSSIGLSFRHLGSCCLHDPRPHVPGF